MKKLIFLFCVSLFVGSVSAGIKIKRKDIVGVKCSFQIHDENQNLLKEEIIAEYASWPKAYGTDLDSSFPLLASPVIKNEEFGLLDAGLSSTRSRAKKIFKDSLSFSFMKSFKLTKAYKTFETNPITGEKPAPGKFFYDWDELEELSMNKFSEIKLRVTSEAPNTAVDVPELGMRLSITCQIN